MPRLLSSRYRLPRPLRLAPVLVGAAALGIGAACSKAPDVNATETASESRLVELERAVHDLKAENDAAKQALGASGNENVSVARRVAELMDKVRRLEEQAAAVAAAPKKPEGAAPDSSSPSVPTPPGAAIAIAPAADGTFPPDQLVILDSAMKAVELKRQEQAERDRLHEVLTRADLTLTSDQEAVVIKLQREYQKKRQELYNAMGMPRRGGAMQSDAERAETRGKLEELQVQHENDLRAALPSSVAEGVVTAMKQSFPGFFPRDRTMRAGMGN